ncbi:IS66 family insertion sequence element accessory protein TnpB [Butyrivibrio sp.]|uniref:IS66 family insertion sequence element accessory protein TnpB n=1 Tax=Butyrivibrio sp. TaxID=28121 RepID=UPI0025C096D5|nr:IS66 family insertion sequence element accessory protein TnpB [Butyrivibrio sp.]
MSYPASLRRCVMLKDADFNYFPAVYVVCGYTDLRCGIDSLAAIIERKYKVNLFVPNTLFLFCGRSSTRIKGLLWEGDGFLLLYKRVEQGRFVWPRTSEELRQLRPEQFKWLMQGFALDPLIYDIQPGYSA